MSLYSDIGCPFFQKPERGTICCEVVRIKPYSVKEMYTILHRFCEDNYKDCPFYQIRMNTYREEEND